MMRRAIAGWASGEQSAALRGSNAAMISDVRSVNSSRNRISTRLPVSRPSSGWKSPVGDSVSQRSSCAWAASLSTCARNSAAVPSVSRSIRSDALAQDREAAVLAGVEVDRMSAIGFGIGAGLAGIAGALLVTVSGVNTGIGTAISIKAFIVIMIGGAGVVAGSLLGAVVLGYAEALGYALIPGSVTYLLIFLCLILFLIVRPNGIMGKPWG